MNVAAAYPAPGWDNPARTLSKDEGNSGSSSSTTSIRSSSREAGSAPEDPSLSYAYRVSANPEVSRSAFTINAKVTRLSLDHHTGFTTFTMRETAVRGESQKLPLADLPIPNAVTGTRIDLDGFYLGFEAGRKVLLEGEPVDLPGARACSRS